jgi:hypothetical protein
MTPDDTIELDFGQYWIGCKNKRLKISTIVQARKYGLRTEELPLEVQEKMNAAYQE